MRGRFQTGSRAAVHVRFKTALAKIKPELKANKNRYALHYSADCEQLPHGLPELRTPCRLALPRERLLFAALFELRQIKLACI